MAQSAMIKRVSARHDAIMNWMVLNPDKSLRECALTFGITQPWLSTLIHSDAFQKQLREKQQTVQSRIAASITGKLQTLADLALDRMQDVIANTEDPKLIKETVDMALHRMGFAPASARLPAGSPQNPQALVQQNNFYVSGEDMRRVQQKMLTAAAPGRHELRTLSEEDLRMLEGAEEHIARSA